MMAMVEIIIGMGILAMVMVIMMVMVPGGSVLRHRGARCKDFAEQNNISTATMQ